MMVPEPCGRTPSDKAIGLAVAMMTVGGIVGGILAGDPGVPGGALSMFFLGWIVGAMLWPGK